MRVAVIGAGVVGLSVSAALLDLGVDVTCFEKGAPMSERSAGRSRIFRLAHSTPELVRFAQRARIEFDHWAERAGTPLVETTECVITSPDLHTWASAMRDADAPFSVVGPDSDKLRLPSHALPAELLVDHSGGVIDVEAVAAVLLSLTTGIINAETAYAIAFRNAGVRIQTTAGSSDFDAVVVAAGSGTCTLATQVGLYTPSALAHHVRFTFPMRKPAPLQCWIDKPERGLQTYQHMSAPGEWAVGGQIDLDKTAWEVGPSKAIAASRDLVLRYVRERLYAVEAHPTDQLYCTMTPGLGDGFKILRNGPALAVYGENLFKHAPALGGLMAQMTVDGTTSGESATVYAV